MDSAVKAIRANYSMRNQRAFSEKPRQDRLATERKKQIRDWIAVVRILQDPMNHNHVLARVTDHGAVSGRNLMAHVLRNCVMRGGEDAMAERAQDQQQAERPPARKKEMTTSAIQAFARPKALRSSPLSRKGWVDVSNGTCNGWHVVTAEQHRVTLLKGDDLVFFAPAQADFDNPVPLDEQDKASALAEATKWAQQNSCLTS